MVYDSGVSGCKIRLARHTELAIVRRLVPNVYTASSAPDRVLVAAQPGDDEIIGVVAIAWRGWGKPPGFPIFIYVVDCARRHGLGRALVIEAARACRSDIDRFHGWMAAEAGTPEALFARAIGFQVHRRTLHFEADGLAFYSMIDAIHARIRRRARIPPGVTTVPLASVPHASVARLVSATFGSRYDVALANTLGSGAGGYDREKSVVLLVDNKVCGALLYRWAGGTPQIDVNVVAPQLRRGWGNVALLHHAVRNGLEAGARSFRFHCEDSIIDTVNLARRANAKLLRTVLEFSVALDDLLR